jgi:hypothetical protein
MENDRGLAIFNRGFHHQFRGYIIEPEAHISFTGKT